MIRIDWREHKIDVDGKLIEPSHGLNKVLEFVTDSRKLRIEKVLNQRSSHFVPVLENIYDRGNISAVMRSAEAFGFYKFHIIEKSDQFKESARVTQGADKWLDINKWNDTSVCIKSLKAKGYKVFTTHLSEDAKDFSEISFNEPVALILGNERDGVSKEALKEADGNVLLPMAGFTQSFNISVAGALSCFQAYKKIKEIGDFYVENKEKEALKALYYLKSINWSSEQLKDFLSSD